MGCSGSKEENLPLVVRCRERRELIRAAANHRYALAAAHVSYFRSLKDVGDALRKFVDEELITTSPSSSSSSLSSPSLILPPGSKKKHDNGGDESVPHLHDDDGDDGSHLHLSDDSSSEDEDSDHYRHHHHESEDQHHKGKGFDDEAVRNFHNNEGESSSNYPPRGGFNEYGNGFGSGYVNDPFQYPYPYSQPPPPYSEPYMDQWGPQQGMQPPQMQPWYYSTNSNMYFMKKSAPAARTVVQEPPPQPSYGYSDSFWSSAPGYGGNGNYGYFPTGSRDNDGAEMKPKVEAAPPPPPSPKGTTWDFFNPFDVVEDGYPGYYSSGKYGYASESSSPDSVEVRQREGIPDLEEETESEISKEPLKGNKMKPNTKRNPNPNSTSMPIHKSRDGKSKSNSNSRSEPIHNSESSSKSIPSWSSDESEKPSHYRREGSMPSTSTSFSEETASKRMSMVDERSSSLDNVVLKSVDERSVKKKGVTFEVEETSKHDGDSSILSSITVSSPPRGTRDLKEAVAEIRDEFETAASYGKEVAVLLEVGKLPYQPSFLKVIVSRILCLISPSLSTKDPPSLQSVKLASSTMKMARSYFEDLGQDVNAKACNLSATLDMLYAWENKLYKEVKDEERLRVMYEKLCKRLKDLDDRGAEPTKIDATRASIRKLLTKLDVSIRAIDSISSRIHKLRDEELQPQIAELIHGLIRMWKAMLICHQKQFHAIMESKMRRLRANTGLQSDSGLQATTELERELRAWCGRFNEWIGSQKSYVESLNGWLLQCLQYEPEESPDGPVPYSPSRLGAPSIFVICNDWQQAMEAVSEARVASAMNTFATSLRQLWEKQDEEGRQRLRAEYLSKDYEKQLREHHRMEREKKMKTDHEHDTISEKTEMSVVPSDSGVSHLDDLKVDLDSMRQKLTEEKIKHKDAMKLVHDAASSSLQGGLVPIFKALESFTSDALKAHEHVRLEQQQPEVIG